MLRLYNGRDHCSFVIWFSTIRTSLASVAESCGIYFMISSAIGRRPPHGRNRIAMHFDWCIRFAMHIFVGVSISVMSYHSIRSLWHRIRFCTHTLIWWKLVMVIRADFFCLSFRLQTKQNIELMVPLSFHLLRWIEPRIFGQIVRGMEDEWKREKKLADVGRLIKPTPLKIASECRQWMTPTE